MPNKSRQQQQNNNARKAKARAKAAAEHRTYKDRPRFDRLGIRPSPMLGMGLAREAASRMFTPVRTEEDRERNERLLCRLLGEPYRP